MTTSVTDIKTKISDIISTETKNKISEEDKINEFLDNINNVKRSILARKDAILKIDGLLIELTWYDAEDEETEAELDDLMKAVNQFHTSLLVEYVALKRRFPQKKLFKIVLSELKSAIDDLEDSAIEVDNIFFGLRKDDEFNTLAAAV